MILKMSKFLKLGLKMVILSVAFLWVAKDYTAI